jgi:ABC-type amino acid transport system permease subunit
LASFNRSFSPNTIFAFFINVAKLHSYWWLSGLSKAYPEACGIWPTLLTLIMAQMAKPNGKL